MMQNLCDFLPEKQLTVPEVAALLKKGNKKKKEDSSPASIKREDLEELNITPPFLLRQKNSKMLQTSYERKIQFLSNKEKQSGFLRRNQKSQMKQKSKKKRLAFQTLGNEEQNQKKRRSKPKFTFLKRGETVCEPICGLFKIKCQNCKPGLDCFNDKFEVFLRENNLWILTGSKKKDNYEEEIKRGILSDIIVFYKEHGQGYENDIRMFQLMEEQAMANIKKNMMKKMRTCGYSKLKQQEMIHWFCRIYKRFRKEFQKQVKVKKEIIRNNQAVELGKLQHKTQQNSMKKSRVKGHQRYSSMHGFEATPQKQLENHKQNEQRKRISILRNSRRQSIQSSQNFAEKLLKIRKNQSGRKVLEKELIKNKIVKNDDKKKTRFDRQMYRSSESSSDSEDNNEIKSVKKTKTAKKILIMEDQQGVEEKQQAGMTEKPEDRAGTRKRKERRKGIIQRLTLPPDESQLYSLKARIDNHKRMLEKVEEYLDEIDRKELKVKETDSVFTLSRKQRHLGNINCTIPEIKEDFQDYKKMVKEKIQHKLKRVKKIDSEQKQNLKKDVVDEKNGQFELIESEDFLKSLNFYDLYEVPPDSICFPSLQNKNFIKSLYKDYYISHKVSEKRKKRKLPSFLLREESKKEKREEELIQVEMKERAVEQKIKK